MRPARRIEKLGGYSNAVATAAQAAFEDIAHPQLAADLADVDGAALIGEARIARDHKEPLDAREPRDDFLDHAVGEIFLLRIAAQIGERQHGDRRLVRQCKNRRRWPIRRDGGSTFVLDGGPNVVGAHRPGDILDLLFAHIVEGDIELALDIATDAAGDADGARLGQRFEPCGNIHPVAKYIAVLNNDIALVDTDAKRDAPPGRNGGIAYRHRLLHLDGAAHRIDDAGEFDEQPVAGSLHDASAMLLDLGVRQFAAQRRQGCMCALLVLLHEARIAGGIGGQYGGQPALDPLLLPGIHYGWPFQGQAYNKLCSCDSTTGARLPRREPRGAPYSSGAAVFS